jgi:hypothetical protein
VRGGLGSTQALVGLLETVSSQRQDTKLQFDEDRAAKNNKTRIIAVGAAPRVSSSYSGIV